MNYDSVPLRDFKDLDDWETVIFVYKSALKQIETKIDILNDEFQHRHKYNPIEHVKSRIKTPESIVKKLTAMNPALKIWSVMSMTLPESVSAVLSLPISI